MLKVIIIYIINVSLADPCTEDWDTCNLNAICDMNETYPFYSCECNAGYSGNGTDCTGILYYISYKK